MLCAKSLKGKEKMDQMLNISGVETAVGLKKSKIYQLVRAGGFPAGLKLGARTRRWPSSHVQAWITQQIQGVGK